MRMIGLVTMRDLHVPGGRKYAVHGEPANVGESLATNWASRLVLSPFHDADEAKVVAAAIDFPCDRNPSLRVANPATNALFVVLILLYLGFRSLLWRTERRRRRTHPRRISQLRSLHHFCFRFRITHCSEPYGEEDKLHPTRTLLLWPNSSLSRLTTTLGPEAQFHI
ncbi:hypothetical protein V8G54_015534 [Vigna mungo]|uniref:Uncharacterized protein n=1 Tax=Vigna mungo TaxID=3915 RepID=A0AAQ3RWY0_VIGMU